MTSWPYVITDIRILSLSLGRSEIMEKGYVSILGANSLAGGHGQDMAGGEISPPHCRCRRIGDLCHRCSRAGHELSWRCRCQTPLIGNALALPEVNDILAKTLPAQTQCFSPNENFPLSPTTNLNDIGFDILFPVMRWVAYQDRKGGGRCVITRMSRRLPHSMFYFVLASTRSLVPSIYMS